MPLTSPSHDIDMATACYRSGMACFKQAELAKAIDFLKKATVLQPDMIEAWYCLGLACKRQDQTKEAIVAFETVLTLQPDHPAARFHLGCLFMQQENTKEALTQFDKLAAIWPQHPETLVNLATCYLKNHALDQAAHYYEQALGFTPEDAQVLFNLGVIHAQLGNTDLAIQYYQRAAQQQTDDFATHYNLALLFLAKQSPAFAMQSLMEAKRLQPSHTTVNYLIHSLKENPHLTMAPLEHLTTLFDSYADHYDPHLLTALEYAIPSLFAARLQRVTPRLESIDVLDIGCGTGLCGEALRNMAHSVQGIDLSASMLEKARKKGCYDELVQADFQEWLEQCNTHYDLIVAGDVLVYLGSLDTLFPRIYRALKKNGLFLFNTEISEDVDYRIRPSGRFGHSRKYLQALAKRYHFKILSCDTITSRQQRNTPVTGYLCLLQRN